MKPAIALDSILQAYEARNLLGGHNFLTYTLSAHCALIAIKLALLRYFPINGQSSRLNSLLAAGITFKEKMIKATDISNTQNPL